MKDMFPEYYRPSKEDFAKLWEESIFVFDANVLLDIYRYSPQTSNELIEIIQNLEDRVWLPYQFAFEYHKHLDEMSTFPPNNYDDAISQFEKLHNQLVTELNNLKNRTRIETEQWSISIKDTFENIKTEIAQQKTEHREHLKNDIPSLLDEIFKNKIGSNYSQEELNKIYREGKERYKRYTPPGYKDEKKGEPDCYNDLVGWMQMIDFAQQEKHPIIFITRDTKEDWFREVRGIKSPRPELIKEMRDKASVSFYMYQTPQFMTYAREYLNSQISDESINEAEVVQSSNSRSNLEEFGSRIHNITSPIGSSSLNSAFSEAVGYSSPLSQFAEMLGSHGLNSGFPTSNAFSSSVLNTGILTDSSPLSQFAEMLESHGLNSGFPTSSAFSSSILNTGILTDSNALSQLTGILTSHGLTRDSNIGNGFASSFLDTTLNSPISNPMSSILPIILPDEDI